jgi:phosphonate transport system substrate-binding protein
VPVRFETANDIPTFEACLSAGAYDFAYMNPVHYTIFSEASGYRALARQSDKRLHGLIVVRHDSDFHALEDLSGAEVAFPSPGAFGASVVPRAEMQALGIEFSPRYVKSHDSVYRAVAAGLLPAGGGVLRTFNAVDPSIREQLRVIYRTEDYTPHALASRSDIPNGVVASVQAILADITAHDPELARSVGMNGFETAVDQDWDDVRALNLGARETGILTESAKKCPSG